MRPDTLAPLPAIVAGLLCHPVRVLPVDHMLDVLIGLDERAALRP